MGETLIRTGAVGSAHAMKALNNYVHAAGLLAAAEALRLGEALGLDLGVLADVMNASSGRNIATETKVKQEILPGRYQGGFQLGLMRKDLDIGRGDRRRDRLRGEGAGALPRALDRSHGGARDPMPTIPKSTATSGGALMLLTRRLALAAPLLLPAAAVRAQGGLARPADPPGGRLPGRQRHRHADAPPVGAAGARARPARHHRQPPRRQRRGRHRQRRPRRPGWAYLVRAERDQRRAEHLSGAEAAL